MKSFNLFLTLFFCSFSSADIAEVIGSVHCRGELSGIMVQLTGTLSANCASLLESTSTTKVKGKLTVTFDFGENVAPPTVLPMNNIPVIGKYENFEALLQGSGEHLIVRSTLVEIPLEFIQTLNPQPTNDMFSMLNGEYKRKTAYITFEHPVSREAVTIYLHCR